MNRSFQSLVFLAFLWIGFSCSEDKGMMLRQLEALEQANRDDSLMTNDSLAETLVTYFDKHGSANERMRARYMLGRTYYDLGELPHALETYLEAADCADTLSSDCDYKVLSRIHAQSANIYNEQLQPQNQLRELRKAEFYAKRGKDTLMAIECYAERSYAYQLLNKRDSMIIIEETAARMFRNMSKEDRYAQSLGGAIIPLVEKHKLNKARNYIEIYEAKSGFFDKDGNIKRGREIYYYAKGKYYLAANQVDSAEAMFRKLLVVSSLNCQIAGNKGLQQVYQTQGVPDSIAKYANLGYILNDSAYSLSEMQNLQKMRASYDYNHKQLLAEQEKNRANHYLMILIIFSASVIICILFTFYFIIDLKKKKDLKIYQYRQDLERLEKTQTELMQLRSYERQEAQDLISSKDAELNELHKQISIQLQHKAYRLSELESKLDNSVIARRLRDLLKKNPPEEATLSDFKELRSFMNEAIPSFYLRLNTPNCSLRLVEYNVCLLVRFHFKPAEISKLTGLRDNHISNIRKTILYKIFNINGSPKELDDILLQIKE